MKESEIISTLSPQKTIYKEDADALLKAAFPDYQKVNGVGPEDAVGLRKKGKWIVLKKEGHITKIIQLILQQEE
ncbi:hypothetical protein MUU47_08910 [Scandinavium sp. H11S7]|uniref:Uncharacterized protein n=1 Tax=Scandinavium hiltneri TaxID=2926519 RepID=A0ABT2E0A2_9ENTR|nr:hypothetical protein [Scandinavium hiltneri]MCS2161240.1 hypothetical protein [Scandinavium hiltneri]